MFWLILVRLSSARISSYCSSVCTYARECLREVLLLSRWMYSYRSWLVFLKSQFPYFVEKHNLLRLIWPWLIYLARKWPFRRKSLCFVDFFTNRQNIVKTAFGIYEWAWFDLKYWNISSAKSAGNVNRKHKRLVTDLPTDILEDARSNDVSWQSRDEGLSVLERDVRPVFTYLSDELQDLESQC